MHYIELASHLQRTAPLERQLAERLVLSVLQGMASMLRGGSAHAFATALSFPLAQEENVASGGIERIEERVEQALAVDALRAREYVQITLAVLARHADEVVLSRLRSELPDSVEAQLQHDVVGRTIPQRPHHVGHGRSLADGRPGSRRPMSEAPAGSTRPVSQSMPGARQQNSVAESNPHADTKISSAAGLTQEREGESLASRKAPR